MRIGELATRTGVSVRSLRYYEEQGLLASTRSASGQRHYTDDEIARVAFIQQLYAAGLSSRTISDLLPCVESPSAEHTADSLARMVQERDRLSQHIDDLATTREVLDGLIAVARADHECRLANAAPADTAPPADDPAVDDADRQLSGAPSDAAGPAAGLIRT